MLSALAVAGLAVFLFMTAVYVLALFKQDNSIVDVGWGLGFICVALITLFRQEEIVGRQILITTLVIVWGSRLALHIALRKRGKGEDWRYARWRRDWGKWFLLRSYFQIYMLQGVFLMVIVFPVVLVNFSSAGKLGFLDGIGALVWLVGFFFEAVGDYQLVRFKKNPQNKGEIMTAGLWTYTRHPNYFGESVMWWGIYLIALSVPYGWAAIFSPVFIMILLLRVSGVTMLEKKYERDVRFTAYAKKTSPFFPWFPKS